MMLLSEIIGDCDLTQKILSLHTSVVLPVEVKRKCSQQRKREMGKLSRFLMELKACIVCAVRRKEKKKKDTSLQFHQGEDKELSLSLL